MLYFSKLKIILIYIIVSIFSFFALSNFLKFQENSIYQKKINLGLDLQGGSYLLLEVDTNPIIDQKMQVKLLELRKLLKLKKIKYKNLIINNNQINFEIDTEYHELIENIILSKENNSINIYYNNYKDYELNFSINNNIVSLFYSKYGIVELNKNALDQSLEIVRRRIDEVGTKEPTILKRGSNRILVELPGIDEPNRIKKLLGKTANLTFRFVSESETSEFGTKKLFMDKSEEQINVSNRIILTGDNLVDAKPTVDNRNNLTVVSFTLDRVGAKRFAKATNQSVGRRLAIILDNKVISAPVIREAIIGGSGQISGDFDFQSATDLALLLRSGALPAPLNIIEERTVGPDLGEDSINAGVYSFIIGFILVILFMLFKYKYLGIIANVSLIVNLLLLIGILTLFEATLTLPGIAGIILTVGMAVDANVLIFQRIKEEMKIEKSNIIAFDSGYKKARSAVLDANITTLISAIILFLLGSGPVKGFALTLGVGIITTLFTIYFFARHLTSFYVMKNKEKNISI